MTNQANQTDQTQQPVYTDIDTTQPDPHDAPTTHSAQDYKDAEQAIKELTPESYLEIMDTINSLESQATMPEAGGVAYCDLYSTKGVKISITARGIDSVQAIKGLMRGVAFGIKQYKFVTQDPKYPNKPLPNQQATEQTAPAPAPVASNAPTQAPAPAAATTQAPQPVAPDSGNFIAVKMVVTPQANERVKIELYGNDKKKPVNDYPTMHYNNTADNCAKLLANTGAWTEQHFAKPAEYTNLSYNVFWKNSTRLNNKNVPYKDIVSVVKV